MFADEALTKLCACRVPECKLLSDMLDVLAGRFPATKFMRIISTHCIPQYPDRNLPTVLVYKDTKCVETLMGLLPYGGRRLTPERALPLPIPSLPLPSFPLSC